MSKYFKITYGDLLKGFFLHKLIAVPLNVVKALRIFLYSPRDDIPFKSHKKICRQDTSSIHMDL